MKDRIWLVLLAAGIVGAGWWQWNRSVPPVRPVTPQALRPLVRLASADAATPDQILRERAELLDPTPLFFPTEWNYGQQSSRETALRQPDQVFGSFEAKLPLSEQGVTLYKGESAPVPEKLSDVLGQGNEASFGGMGQIDRQTSTLSIRSGFLEVRDLGSGETIISQSLVGISPPRNDFAPVEFLVVISSAGMVGEPVVTIGSEEEDVDSFFRDYLIRSYRLGERLRPGRYRVWVGA
jgi:hypothetical protein